MLPISEANAGKLEAISRGQIVQWAKDAASLYGDCAGRLITAREAWPK